VCVCVCVREREREREREKERERERERRRERERESVYKHADRILSIQASKQVQVKPKAIQKVSFNIQ